MLPILREGLVLELHFNELNGDIAYDLSGNGNNGTIYGATRVNEGFVRALSFDGVDDYVFVPRSLVTDEIGLDFSVAVWVATTETGSAGYGKAWIVEKDLPAARQDDWFFGINYGKVYLVLGDKVYYSDDVIADGLWHFIGFSRKKDTKVVLFWDTKTKVFADPGYDMRNTQNIYIGSEKGRYKFFRGPIDEVLIFNRALSEEEIKTLYNYYTKKKIFER